MLAALLTVLIAGALRPPDVLAQTSAEQRRAYDALAAPANLAPGALIGSSLEGSFSPVELVLEGTEDQGVGTAAIGFKRGSSLYRAKFSSPISKTTKEALPFDLFDGVPPSATFEFTVANLTRALPSDADIRAFSDLCMAELKVPGCQLGELPAAVRAEGRSLLRHDARPVYLGVSALVSNKTFDYLDASLAEQSAAHRNVALGLRFGAFNETFGFAFLTWSYQHQFKPGGNPEDICQPIGGTAATTCSESVRGAPTKQTSNVVGAELRHWFGAGAAMSPSIKRDLKTDVTYFALPIYFMKNKAGALTGGVRANWRSDTSKLTFLVFVGTAFSPTP